MDTEKIRNTSIKRHDVDADEFQAAYSNHVSEERMSVFQYGRNMIIEELEMILSKLPAGGKVLDVGCGTAHLTNWIKDKGFEVYGIEPSENMYNHAVKNFPDIEIKRGISSSIPYPNNYFDLVIAVEVLRYLNEPDNFATYKEFFRVLKPNGRFFITQVNLFCNDLYFFYHPLKGVWRKLHKSPHPWCNFTTWYRQEKIAGIVGFEDIITTGRMEGSIRIFYKFGNLAGVLYKKVVEKLSKQKHSNSLAKLFSGHLIVTGLKK